MHRQVAKPDGPKLDFLHNLPVGLMWVCPVTKAELAEIGVDTIGQLARMRDLR